MSESSTPKTPETSKIVEKPTSTSFKLAFSLVLRKNEFTPFPFEKHCALTSMLYFHVPF